MSLSRQLVAIVHLNEQRQRKLIFRRNSSNYRNLHSWSSFQAMCNGSLSKRLWQPFVDYWQSLRSNDFLNTWMTTNLSCLFSSIQLKLSPNSNQTKNHTFVPNESTFGCAVVNDCSSANYQPREHFILLKGLFYYASRNLIEPIYRYNISLVLAKNKKDVSLTSTI